MSENSANYSMTYFTAYTYCCSVVRKGSPDPFRYEALLLFLPTSSQLDYLGHQADLLMNMWKLGSEHRLHSPLLASNIQPIIK